MRARHIVALAPLAVLGGCEGWQSAVDPQGPQARHLYELIIGIVGVCTVVFALTLMGTAFAILHRRPERPDPLANVAGPERRAVTVIVILAGLTACVVIAFTLMSFVSQRKLYAKADPALTIELVGRQWWWEARYADPRPDRIIVTANEIHVPVGVPVRFKLRSEDVIHSFWVPNLAGKMDLIPGQENELQFVVDKPGTYRGQCAEFCGLQHAHMGLLVVARERADYEAWAEAQRAPSVAPADDAQRAGREVFLTKPCVMCHTIRGTLAGGKVAPDLTHLASRRFFAAGTLPVSRGNLGAWVVDPHGIKPGVNMPVTQLSPDELENLLSYLMALK